ncbi:MAG: hypothetical protein H0W83_12340 [Planctomycetes bacterium]|nr:hypothetical protein [Planctomycetota bacterium]
MMTIHARVLLVSCITAAASLAVACTAIYLLVRASMLSGFDESLTARAHVVAALVECDDETSGGYEFHAPEASADDVAFMIRPIEGTLIARQGDQRLLSMLSESDAHSGRATSHRLGDGRRVRGLSIAAMIHQEDAHPAPEDRRRLTITIARDTHLLDGDLRRLAEILTAVGCAIGIACALALSVALRAALRPLGRLADDIAALDGRALDRRIQATATPGEMLPIVNRLNELLDRIATGVQKEKSFNAAIAHELRTPLGGLRSTIEVNLGRARDAADHRQALATCLGICLHMNTMVERLLLLSKAEAGQLGTIMADVDLSALVRGCWDDARQKAELRAMRAEATWDGPVVARSDAALAAIIVSNLVDNALSHGEAGGVVRIQVDAIGGSARVRMGNAAPRLGSADVAHVFDRFWRSDQARTDVGSHFGLGMPLCQDLAEIVGGSITARCEAGWFEVEVVLPRGAGS